jgi:DNA-binding NtrC family response regulator
VTLFRDHIVGRDTPLRPLVAAVNPVRPNLSDLDAAILAPVLQQLDRLGDTTLPALICGPAGTGKQRAARYLARKWQGAAREPILLSCGGLSSEDLAQALAAEHKTHGRGKVTGPGTIILQGIEALGEGAQAQVIAHLETARHGPPAHGHLGIIATTCLAPAALRQSHGFSSSLFLQLAAGPVILPDFAARQADLGAMAQLCCDQIAAQCHAPPVILSPEAIAEIAKANLTGNLLELNFWLTAAFLSGQAVTAATLRMIRLGTDPQAPPGTRSGDPALGQWIGDRLANGGIDLAGIEDQVLRAAVQKAGGNLTAAARLVNLTRPQLAYRLDRRQHRSA